MRRRRANTVRQEPITEGNSQPVRSPPYLTSRCRLFMFRLVTLTVPLRDAPGGEEWEVSDRDGTWISGLISLPHWPPDYRLFTSPSPSSHFSLTLRSGVSVILPSLPTRTARRSGGSDEVRNRA